MPRFGHDDGTARGKGLFMSSVFLGILYSRMLLTNSNSSYDWIGFAKNLSSEYCEMQRAPLGQKRPCSFCLRASIWWELGDADEEKKRPFH